MTGEAILNALRASLDEVAYRDGFSFIYRMLGGLRGSDEVVQALADQLADFDRTGVSQGWLQPNGYYWLGRKRESIES